MFWPEAINTTCYLKNKINIRSLVIRTLYELWKNKKSNISYFHPFGVQSFILNTKENLRKFDSKSDEGILLGYSQTSKAYRVYNSRTLVVEEANHVGFNDYNPDKKLSE